MTTVETINNMPEWFGSVVLGAVIAALGYVAKLLLEWLGDVKTILRTRRARLVELISLLRAGKAAYEIQCDHRNRLADSIAKRDPGLAASLSGYERLFSGAYQGMTEDEKEVHTMLRAITVNTLCPLNESLLKWLRDDTYFKAKTWGSGLHVQVAQNLADLEAHLLLWHAKYTVWIPENPAHSLVYLADEERHGVGFPRGIEGVVQELLKRRWWIGG